MARRRMFSLDVVDTDQFLNMPASTQNLYFHLGMRADDDGFVANPRKITSFVNCSIDDMNLLIAKGFVYIFDSGVVVIRDWKLNNYIQSDRYIPSKYEEEKKSLTLEKSGVYTLDTKCIQAVSTLDTKCIQAVSNLYTQDSIDKDSIGKVSIDKDSIGKVSIGKVSIGKVSIGKVSIDKDSIGKVSIDKDRLVQDSLNNTNLTLNTINDKKEETIGIPPSISPPTATSLVDSYAFADELRDTVMNWLRYKKERREGYKETGLKALLSRIQNAASQYGDTAVITVINDSMSSNYTGIVFDRLEKAKPAAKPPDRLSWIWEVNLDD